MITRRAFVAAGALPVAAFSIPARAHVHLDYRNCGVAEHEFLGGKCFVDGREIAMVFYVDTREGIVKTYDAFGDGEAHAALGFHGTLMEAILSQNSFNRFECSADGLFTLTLQGRIELYLSDGRRMF